MEKRADEPVVRYATLLLPTSDPDAEKYAISLGEWSQTGSTVTVSVGSTRYTLSYTL